MTDRELMQQALYLIEFLATPDPQFTEKDRDVIRCVAEALRARLAQPEPEAVAWFDPDLPAAYATEELSGDGDPRTYGFQPLYFSPPQREWAGLTDEELLAVMESAKDFQGRIAMTWVNHNNETYVTDVGGRIARAIEAKLRENNG